MNKMIYVFLLVVSTSLAGYVYPTFNQDRAPWIEWEYYGKPIVFESGFNLGLTNPNSGQTSFDLMFEVEAGVISFNINNYYNYIFSKGNFSIVVSPTSLHLYGEHYGAGNPLNGILIPISGGGIISVIEKNFSTGQMVETGNVRIIPEPSTFLLIGSGIFYGFKKRLFTKS